MCGRLRVSVDSSESTYNSCELDTAPSPAALTRKGRWRTREGAAGVFPATGVQQRHQVVGLQLACILYTDPICDTARPENCEDPSLKSTYRQGGREAPVAPQ